MLVLVLEENLTQSRILILYNVVVENVLVFMVDINLALARFLILQCLFSETRDYEASKNSKEASKVKGS